MNNLPTASVIFVFKAWQIKQKKIVSEQYRIKNLDMLFWSGNGGGDHAYILF